MLGFVEADFGEAFGGLSEPEFGLALKTPRKSEDDVEIEFVRPLDSQAVEVASRFVNPLKNEESILPSWATFILF